jgi:C4-type Zn-finger protein
MGLLKRKKQVKHKFSKEILYHFNCGKCNKWWSIADYHLFYNNVPENEEMVHSLMICPYCGHKETLIEVKNEKI